MNDIRPTHHYIGQCKGCGAILASVYDMADDPKLTGQAVGNMIARSLEVTKVPLGSVSFDHFECTCERKPTDGLPLFAMEPNP